MKWLIIQILQPTKEKEAANGAKFSQLWNQIVASFRQEDLISNRYFKMLWLADVSFMLAYNEIFTPCLISLKTCQEL